MSFILHPISELFGFQGEMGEGETHFNTCTSEGGEGWVKFDLYQEMSNGWSSFTPFTLKTTWFGNRVKDEMQVLG